MKKFIVILLLICCPFIWNMMVKAEEPCEASDAGTLTTKLEDANCKVIKLASTVTNTRNQVFDVKRAVTIEGAAGGSNFAGQFNISETNKETEVTIKNIKLSYRVEEIDNGSSNVLVTSPVKLNIEGFTTSYSYGTLNALKEFRTINFLEGVDESTLNIKNSDIFGAYEGIRIGGSNVEVNIENSTIYGRYGLALGVDKSSNTHESNTINILGSTITGQSTAELESALLIAGQNNLTVNIGKSSNGRESILTNEFYKEASIKAQGADIIRFYNGSDDSLKNENVEIHINDKTKLNDNSQASSSNHLFHFGRSDLDNNNVIYLEKEVELVSAGSNDIPMNKKYNSDQSYVVVGLYDYDGSAQITHYDPSAVDEKINAAISSIESKATSNKYRVKSWHTAKPFDDGNKKADSISTNTDLYPKTVKLYDVSIGGKSYQAEDGQNITDLASTEISQMQDNVANNKVFVTFYEEDGDDIPDINNYTVTKDVTIKARYNVEITVEGDSFKKEIPEGGNLQGLISDLEAIEEAEGKTFKHFEANGREVDLNNTTFDTNTKLVRKYSVNVTIEGKEGTYEIDENQTLENLESKYSVLADLKASQYDGKKKFKKWIITDSNEALEETTPITKHTKIKPVYELDITIGSKTVTIEEGTTWSTLQSTASSELDEIKNVKADRFEKYVIDNNEDLTDDYQFTIPKTITARFYINITIGEQTLKLLEGENFNNLSAEDKGKVEAIVNAPNKKFYRFEKDKAEVKVYENYFDEDTTLVPVYNVTITVNGQEFTLRDDQSINTFNNSTLNDLLKDLSDKKFKHLVTESKEVINKDTIITENKTLTIVYSVDIKFGGETINVDENTKWTDVLSQINADGGKQTALDNLKTNGAKKWAYFVDSDGRIITDDTTFNKHTTLTSKFYVNITINDKKIELVEGKKLTELDETNQAILNEILNPTNKEFDHFEQDGRKIDYNEQVFNDDAILSVIYIVTLTINDKEFKLLDNEPLSTLNLDEFKNINGKDFAYFAKDGVKVEDSTTFSENTTLVPVYNINITIDGETFNNIADNLTFREIKELSGIKEKLATLTNDHFAYFLVNDNQITDDDVISTHSTIKAIYYVFLNVSDVTVKLIQNQKFGELSANEKAKLRPFETLDTKTFKYYTYNNKEVNDNTTFNTDATLIPVYEVNLTINGEVYSIKENGKLSDLGADVLSKIKEATNKSFKHFLKNDGTIIDEENTTFDVHTNLTIVYNVTIKVKNQSVTVDENTTWAEFKNTYSNILSLLEEDNREIARYVDKENRVLEDNTKFDQNTEIIPKFYLTIKINDQTFKLIEEQSLNDLASSELEYIKSLTNLTTKNFKYFVDENGNEITLETALKNNITLTPKYNVTITIGNETFTLDEGKSLKDLDIESQKRLDSLKNVDGKDFLYFTLDNEQINENELFTSNTNLNAVYQITISIGDNKFNVLENTSYQDLLANEDFIKALENLKKPTNKTFSHLVNENGEPIKEDEIFNHHTTIKAKYLITVTIGDNIFTLEEGQTLNDLSDDNKAILAELKNAYPGKVLTNYLNKDNQEVINEDTPLYENAVLEAVYQNIDEVEETPNDSLENPVTYDNIYKYLVVALMMIFSIIFGFKKLFEVK